MFHQNPNIFNILFEAIPEGVIIVNDKQTIIAANTSAEKMFGYSKDELMQQSLTILLPKKYKNHHSRYFNSFLEKKITRKIKHGSNLHGVTKEKKQFPVEIGLSPFNLNNETFVIALIIDISIRKENEKKIESLNLNLEKKIKQRTAQLNNTIKQLKELNFNYKEEINKRIEAENKIKAALQKEKELNELKTKFLSLVSHEFKTPLSGILTSTMLLNKYQLTEQQPKRDKHITTIANKVNYLNNILNDFLSIERLETNKITYTFTTFNLSKIVNEVVYNANLMLKNGQKISTPQNIDEFTLHQDEKILQLSLSNIIYNAIKYSPNNTTINLNVFKQHKNIVFEISDEGIGIPENDQKFIFNRYFRAENVLNEQGTGIGLNIVKSHLENIGGSITFKSKEHQGSVFTFKIPITSKL
ncbi:ATP-binding protein [Lutibacter holmesii]|uniref:histidine kinase n=1 Tax=Lutibacter holmesii TaxID=1137985 RepID=A0ABW3WJW4_9FLAO